ncbi:NmrA family NAD(P)-binding protein [Actinoplanes sp. TBRC 11911]|uniref:NmrA family NAD(P)-binding protein n=1 Tax=Actinoplanes sp. TBRC 11911 TaxID=2729386 RepID=UPI00145DD63E|nr:NmrA family NAD(P)-binding protein [Actinoplanes sp. TBRC 11911]NMO55714.1 NmrA family NAD(P)-binding protein [Actinoplanes sp. TBRC 11911]
MARSILVTGATGKTGEYATAALLRRGLHVRALVHRAGERSEKLTAAGAEVVVGDLLDLDSVSRAADGVDAAYFVYPVAPGLLEATATFLQAAEENGVRSIVNMSQISARRDAVSNAARQHWVAERLLDHFGGTVTHLRPTFFAEWLISTFDRSTGELRLPFEDARHAPIATEDLGRVIAAVLADPEPHAGKSYPLYGAVELDHHQMAEIMTRVLGRHVTYVPVELDEFQAGLEKRGADPHFVQHMVNIAIDYRNGIFTGNNDVVRTITGTGPLMVDAFIERNKPAFADSANWNRR